MFSSFELLQFMPRNPLLLKIVFMNKTWEEMTNTIS